MWFFPNKGLLLLHQNIIGLRGLQFEQVYCSTPPKFYNAYLKFVNFESKIKLCFLLIFVNFEIKI